MIDIDRALCTLVFASIASQSAAVGLRLPNQDPDAIARGNAFVATADNPSAIYHNPAGITQLEGKQFSLGGYFISADVSYESATGDKGQTDSSVQIVPQLHYVYSPENSPYSFGIGLYVPYGLGIDYGNNNPFPTLAKEGELSYLSVNPVLSYQVSENLSVGAGLTFNYSTVNLTQELGLIANDEFNYEGDGVTFGYNLGLLWKASDQVSLGASYRSETKVDYQGRSQATSNEFLANYVQTALSVTFPQHLDVGFAYHPSSSWTLETNIDWTDWSVVDSTAFVGTALGDLPFNFNYKDSLMYEFGISKSLENGFTLSGGYIYSENSAPDLNFTPYNPDSDLQLGSIGIASKLGSVNWSLAYHFAYNGGRQVINNQSTSLLGETADGRYKTLNHAVNFSFSKSF